MLRIELTPQYFLPASKSTPYALLEHLIDVLAHPNTYTHAWLIAISSQADGFTRPAANLAEAIRLGASAGVSQAVAYRIALATAKARGLGWSPDGVRSLVASIYRQVHEDQQNESAVQAASQPSTPEQAVTEPVANNG